MNIISKIIIPLFVVYIIYRGLKYKIDVYDSFLRGAKEGLITCFNIFPAMLAMIFAINIFLNSGIINFLLGGFKSIFTSLNIPFSVFPMALLRPISGNASLAILNDILRISGPDSYAGRLASVLQGCTDTTVYVIALYFSSVRISKTKYALPVGLFADLMGILAAFIITKIFFG